MSDTSTVERVADALWATIAPVLGGARVADVWEGAAMAAITAIVAEPSRNGD